ncbi:TetR/AcrR family transcriptional regulator [Burkholderia sp. AU31624]|uniref:TetR/AcrR family transcriptional regulator n=1 Tax=Burkholderia sp. AU31624 TaxID=2879629 RepID=UPI001CF32863|nr:TetR/AcrR family transcriptional regulator [Burkholderia sp. AU31624]MCA8256872.1 TetR/AcrR family transcriptional regulator [Burkholderia sp. AU31624]
MQQEAVKRKTSDHSEDPGLNTRPAARRNRELRIKEIIFAARQVFQEDGYTGFATRRVADRVGITQGNLQYYFRTKEELLRAALLAFMNQTVDDYAAIANQPGISATRRCTALVERIFRNVNETDLPKFMVEVWAFARHEPYAAELIGDMYARYRGIFEALLSEIHPELTSDESMVRASVIVSQIDGMTIFASHGEFPEKDYAEFVRLTKRVVKAIVSMPAQMLERERSLLVPSTRHLRDSNLHAGIMGSDGPSQQGRLDLRTHQSAQDALYYRPTAQGRRREIKINEIISTATTLLASEGYANFTLAGVARELGILPSALQNYFPTHDDLLRSTIGAIGKLYLDRYAEIGKPSSKPALERLCEIAEDVFEEARDPEASRLWVEMFALALHSDLARELVRSVYVAYRALCADLIREIDPSATARECLARATLIAAQVDGAGTLMLGEQKRLANMDHVFSLMMNVAIRIAHGSMTTGELAPT